MKFFSYISWADVWPSTFDMIYFTADTHFSHYNIIKYCNRPFLNTVDHDSFLIDYWNAKISKKRYGVSSW
jgi:calcineurin-like phosphoesterase family protein